MHPTSPAHARWDAPSPAFEAGWGKVMMWLFLLSDTLTFSGLLGGYGYLRASSEAWPVPEQIFNVNLVGLMTFLLICSSATMAAAVGAARQEETVKTGRLLGLTVLGGLIFLAMQAYEWTHFIHAGARLASNPWGVPLFSTTFFVITGFHGLHVTAGVIYLTTVALRALQGRLDADGVETAGLYWHFVDLVWVFVFTFLYLI